MPNNGEAQPIRVLLVEDSLLQLHIIKSVLDADPHTEVVGTAVNGAEALKLLPTLKPDVICTDYHMPVMDGLEFIEKAIKVFPCPILVLSISVQPDQVENIFKLLSAGAIDVMAKPRASGGVISKDDGRLLVEKIRILNGVRYIQKKNRQPIPNPKLECRLPNPTTPKMIVIGASTGGPQALEVILPRLKNKFPIPIVCIQHISHGFLKGMITWLATLSSLVIETAKHGQIPQPGHLYFPPEGMHLTFSASGALEISSPTLGDIYCPSIDKLFLSTSEAYGDSVVAVILSGMGRDGASGIKSVFDAGGDTIAQDEESSIIFGMPAVAINSGAVSKVLSPTDIAIYFNKITSSK